MSISPGNEILRSLPADELERLRPILKNVRFTPGARICGVDEPLPGIWFPETGAASRLNQLLTGETVEVGIAGNDGVIGLPLVLGGTRAAGACVVQIEGTALMISATDFEEHVRRHGGPLFDALMLYTNLYLLTLTQLTACHCLHRIEQRLSRCILTLSDYAGEPYVRITHDTLAEFLGVHRPSITYALQALADSGTISLERRRILIAHRDLLIEHTCECYGAIRNTTAREIARIRATLQRP